MPYCTLDDIKDRLPEAAIIQLTDDTNLGSIDETKVAGAIARADKEIDAWCGGRYAVPFSSTPAIVAELSADMAVYFLYGRTQDEIPEFRKDAYKNAVRVLEKISQGQVSLGVDPSPAKPSGAGAAIVSPSSDSGRRFTRDKTKGGF